jgi:hypothetical protein
VDGGVFEMTVGGNGLKDFGIDSPTAAAELMDEQRRDRAEFEIGGVEVGVCCDISVLLLVRGESFLRTVTRCWCSMRTVLTTRTWRSATGQSTSGCNLLPARYLGRGYVGEIMRCLQGAFAQAPVVRLRGLSMRMDLVDRLEVERGWESGRQKGMRSRRLSWQK